MTQPTILLVDDDPEDLAIIDDAIQETNAPVTLSFARNGEEALNRLGEFFRLGQLPSLVVLDLNMPKMNGTETLRNLKKDERFKQIPVIIYSTSINPYEKEKCMLLGAHSHITKPISMQERIDTINSFMEICIPPQ